MVTVSEETTVDYELTARIATEAFAQSSVHFSPERIKWLYERSFGRGTSVLAATDGTRKIGQVAMIGQTMCVNGEVCASIQLVDLFILQAYRSGQLVRRLYKEVERLCTERNIRFILALPNDKSVMLTLPQAWSGALAPHSRRRVAAAARMFQDCAIPACSPRCRSNRR